MLTRVEHERPKPADVALAAGVSRATASRARNGRPGTTEAVRIRVREVAARLPTSLTLRGSSR
ncbi:LacI family DNA-binding transcriptional regulator [Dactylosporangium matsuzakiense]|uniref:LacI family DNA-binding transcriptional regulator n=1 Tax=Dactylosporangium matsuzakiense TaxID=53360 RepID=UPI0021C2FDAA|nr:LacI family DNA-binding transcriptional regulator [Dactylosporangium matsuzakiense]UWZ41489.1 LacI family DNA-binding transcriptional regulator [Dactylosporangium matsuzakiense]